METGIIKIHDWFLVRRGCLCVHEPEGETHMADDCRHRTIIATHDPESFPERGAAIGGAQAFAQIVDKTVVYKHVFSGMLETTETPLIIGRKPIFHVELGGNAGEGYKCLMAHHHAVGETTVCEIFRSREMARSQIPAFVVNEIGLSVDNAGDVIVINGLFYTF